MAKLQDLEFKITASTTELRSDLQRGTAAIKQFADQTSDHVDRATFHLTGLRRKIGEIITLFGVMRVINIFDRWVTDAGKAVTATDAVKLSVLELADHYERLKQASEAAGGGALTATAPLLLAAMDRGSRLLESFHRSYSDFAKEALLGGVGPLSMSRDKYTSGGGFGESSDKGDLLSARVRAEQSGLNQDDSAVNNFVAEMNTAVADRQKKEDDFLTNFIAEMNVAVAGRSREEDAFLTNFVAEMNNAVAEREKSESEFLDNFVAEMNQAEQQRGARMTANMMTDREQRLQELGQAQQMFDKNLISQETLNRMKALTNGAKEFADQFAEAFQTRGVQAFLDGDLRGAVRGLVRDFAELTLRMVFLKPIADQLSNSMQGISTGGGSSSGSGNGWGWLTTLVGSLFGGALAEGGSVKPGMSYLVGERGPEIFSPDAAGTITPNGGGGGVVIHQYFDIQAGLPAQWTAQMMAMANMAGNRASEMVLRTLANRR